MGIRFECPNGHKLHVKSYLAGKRGICPDCGAKFVIPAGSNGHEAPERVQSAVGAAGVQNEAGPKVDSPPPSVVISTVGNNEQIVAQPAPAVSPPSAPEAVPPILRQRTSMWYVRPQTGGQFGPANDELFKSWITEGRVTEETFVWREGWVEWKLAREVGDALPIALPFVVASTPIAVPPAPGEPPAAEPIREEVVSQELAGDVPTEEAPASQAAFQTLNRSMRKRQRRYKFAVLLLLTTIVLTVLLVWVLFRNATQASVERRPDRPQLVQSDDGRYVANFGQRT
jgi:GYF domain 2